MSEFEKEFLKLKNFVIDYLFNVSRVKFDFASVDRELASKINKAQEGVRDLFVYMKEKSETDEKAIALINCGDGSVIKETFGRRR